ncbi:unnamed protein product [Pseudo-nitzschia multistriata]|uniref:Uncharacterized protein n=1 Tax=Pseudo-nitzschia multistriata TaxID=183589 RepID=A0A448ZC87_9STRA|nr:unnamed protein product [Pseudo-nitzschia multistriata]
MEISLGEGMLSGTIPSSFEEFKALEIFDVNSNCLSGPIPNLSRIPSIRRLSLENNLRLWGSLNGFCDHSEYNNPQIDFIRSTCGGCSGKEKSALIECDCCTCCNEEDLTCCDSQGVSSTTSQYGYSYSSPFECPA